MIQYLLLTIIASFQESKMPSKTSFSDIWQCLWHPQLFHVFRIDCFAKTFNGWLPLNAVVGWLCPTCVTGTWVTSWIDVILIWYYYIVICTLVTIFNWWLSSKDMKLRVLIKKVLVVFHWLTLYNREYICNHENKICNHENNVATHALGHMPKGMNYHKPLVVITGREHCFHDCIMDILKYT